MKSFKPKKSGITSKMVRTRKPNRMLMIIKNISPILAI